MASSNAYADPYNNDPNYTYHNSYPTTPQDENPYAHDAEPQYNASNDYTSQPYASTDKMVEPPAEYAGTERVRKGRTGAEGAAKSWGTTGPPPRSTGILRMWRKDERGKQWTRVSGVVVCIDKILIDRAEGAECFYACSAAASALESRLPSASSLQSYS